MRILVVDDRPERASHLKSVLLQKVSANDVIMCRRASDVGDDQSCDFDFIILHFCNDLSEHGDYALAFMDGLISRDENNMRMNTGNTTHSVSGLEGPVIGPLFWSIQVDISTTPTTKEFERMGKRFVCANGWG